MPETGGTDEPGDFKRLRKEGHRHGTSLAIGQGFCRARDGIARALIAIGITPNMLTIAGFMATCGAAVCFLLGGSYSHAQAADLGLPPYMLLAAAGLFLASAFDMLDGAVAKIGGMHTPIGAVLDSSVDRFSDLVVYLALIGHFYIQQNFTYTMLSALALCNASLISYIKARSETLIPDCAVGYWMRGERFAALLIAACAGTIPAVLWQQGLSPALTVLRRLVWTVQVLKAKATGRPAPDKLPLPGWRGLIRPWRYPRGSIPYDFVTGANILFIIFAAHFCQLFGPTSDPLGRLVRDWGLGN